MISTLYLIQFMGFYLWQITSKFIKNRPANGPLAFMLTNRKCARIFGAALLLGACTGFIFVLGVMSGICGFIVGLMGVGCLCVALSPFNYLRLPGIAFIYVCAIILEITI